MGSLSLPFSSFPPILLLFSASPAVPMVKMQMLQGTSGLIHKENGSVSH